MALLGDVGGCEFLGIVVFAGGGHLLEEGGEGGDLGIELVKEGGVGVCLGIVPVVHGINVELLVIAQGVRRWGSEGDGMVGSAWVKVSWCWNGGPRGRWGVISCKGWVVLRNGGTGSMGKMQDLDIGQRMMQCRGDGLRLLLQVLVCDLVMK